MTLGSDGLVDDEPGPLCGARLAAGGGSGGDRRVGTRFGAQGLAVALGGRVDRAPIAAWLGLGLELDPGWIATGPWLAWRDEVIRLPNRARLLAHDPLGPQVFERRAASGVQFHPEVTPEMVGDWVTAGAGRASTPRDPGGHLARVRQRVGGRSALSTYMNALGCRAGHPETIKEKGQTT